MSALLLPLILLLLASAFFSASETALFSLEPHEVEGRGAAFQREALAWCRRHARQVLFVILFSNLAINVLYFALAASLSHDLGGAEAALVSLGAFFALIFLAEILPKSIALGLGPVWALATAPVLYFWTLATSPVTRPATMFLHFLGSRLVVAKPPPSALGEGELVESVRRHPERFGLEPRIAKVVSEVMDAADLQVRELMVPLVDFERLPPETTAREDPRPRPGAPDRARLLVGDARRRGLRRPRPARLRPGDRARRRAYGDPEDGPAAPPPGPVPPVAARLRPRRRRVRRAGRPRRLGGPRRACRRGRALGAGAEPCPCACARAGAGRSRARSRSPTSRSCSTSGAAPPAQPHARGLRPARPRACPRKRD
ncbi:MAG: DUF21 domain-containing protein [Planctomycetota bacterium]